MLMQNSNNKKTSVIFAIDLSVASRMGGFRSKMLKKVLSSRLNFVRVSFSAIGAVTKAFNKVNFNTFPGVQDEV